MPHNSPRRFKVAKRRYSQIKNTVPANEKPLTETAFTKGNDLFRQMFERNRAIKLIIDPSNLQIIEANQAACDFYGYTSEQIKSLHLTDISTLAQSELMASTERTIAAKGSTFQTRHRLASGEIRDVELFTGLLEPGNKLYLYEIIQDITHRKQAEKALRESEELYRRFAKHMPNTSVIMFDQDMRYTLAEGPYLQRSQPSYQSFVGKLPQEILPAESLDFLLPIYRRALQGESFSYERETEDYAYQAYVTPVFSDSGEIIGGMILSHDITEIKKATAALWESEHRHQSMVNTMSEGVVTHGQDGVIQTSNPAAERILGLTADQIKGRASIDPRWHTIHEDGSPFPGEEHPAMITLRTGQPMTNTIMGVHKPDDRLVWILINTRAMIRPNETQPYAVVATLVDITERKQLEDNLRSSEERLRLIIDNIQDLVTYDDVKGNFVFVSPSSRTMLGYEPQSLLNVPSMELIHPMDRSPMTQTLSSAIATREPQFTVEGRLRHADGHYIDIETVGKLVTNGGTSFIGGVFITRDISQRKYLEELRIEKEKLQMALQKEQEFSIYKTRLMRRINQGFRTPLAMIQASVETLGYYWDRITPEQRTGKKAQIEGQIKILTNMLDEIGLVISNSFKPERIRRVSTDLSALCRVVLVNLEREFELPGKYNMNLPEMIIANVDPQVVEKALIHIFRNAAQYSEPSAVVNISLVALKQGIEIRVEDAGSGILPNEQHRIFEPFFRGSNIGEVDGLGVGLTIARAAIEAHGGGVTVMSSHGKNTMVTIWIPN